MAFLPMAMALAPLLMRAAPLAGRALASPMGQRAMQSGMAQGGMGMARRAAASTPAQKGKALMDQATTKAKTMGSKGVMLAQQKAPGTTSRALQISNWIRANPQQAADMSGYGGLALMLAQAQQPEPQQITPQERAQFEQAAMAYRQGQPLPPGITARRVY